MALRTLLALVALALLIAGCNGDDDADQPMSTPRPTAPLTTPQPSPTPDGDDESAAETPPEVQQETPSPAPPGEDATATPEVGPATTPTPEPPPEPTPTPAAMPLDQLTVGLEEVAGGLVDPVGIAVAGDGSNRLFVLEQSGRIRVVQDGALLDQPFLDIIDRVGTDANEQGLLGLAFHPAYPENGYFYVNYTDNGGDTVISRFTVSDDPNVADPASETLVLHVDQPAGNHNGGHLAFGPDGYLWIGLGDGGASGDRFGNAQNPGTLLGSMLRIDVDGAEPYGVPADNPFVGDPGARDETWAIGLRNPWRYSFDRLTGDLYIADVGQGAWEEVNMTQAGSVGGINYGWPILEGTHCYPNDPCATEGLTLPVVDYALTEGNCAVVGGYVYRGGDHPSLWGAYLYADYCSGRFWGLRVSDEGVESQLFFQRNGARFTSFGQDERGELYISIVATGAIYRIVAF